MAAAAPTLPCLVFDYGGEQQRVTLFSVSDGAHRACEIEELRGKRSWPTSHGWVLAWDPATAATFLWNPPRAPGAAAADRIALPPLAHPPPWGSVCALSGDPADAGGRYTVLLAEPAQSTVLWYCHAGGTAAWTRHEYDLGGASIRVPEGEAWRKRTVDRLASCRGRF
ncbi:hypothetical protein C2845_PM09G01790 [Panicum miliaceum]|uniref:KIB1-4 beta-propeller domain-containing protein n=1 Tax=Panicum miliaceum TaxID=4540 RepID=A0A3L6S0U5_PANMI|nr:hypothetical protein C2845_PM09G01790 [Panicum miliaceum]